MNVTEIQKEPESVQEALSSSEKEQWKAAIQNEMESVMINGVWDLVDRKPVRCRWVFKRKINSSNCIERYKACLVAQSFSQQKELDYDEIFCPVIRFESVRTLVAVSVQKGFRLHQLDVTNCLSEWALGRRNIREATRFCCKRKRTSGV